MDTRRRTPTPPVLSREELKEGGKRKVAAVGDAHVGAAV
jgi:hypothetical protein